MNHTRTIISAWLNDSQRSRTGVGMNMFARGVVYIGSPTDTALYKNVPLPFLSSMLYFEKPIFVSRFVFNYTIIYKYV